ncbi:YeeE/YedE thiosulfate transporter family protein [Thermophagus sp. OGC60D27]|uniref:YeeE/YedE thiosulfate transporter family protein n=1 Tax=Thermophagus sp. OGC60D27 TaxID=3458415 RepID=UPI0040376597
MNGKNKYMNPYLAGVLLGFVLLTTIYITGRGLGASGAMKSVAVSAVKAAAPEHYNTTTYYRDYASDHPQGPMKSWLVFEMLGVLVGAFFSGVLSGRIGLKLEKGPGVTNTARLLGAIVGGFLFGFGSQLGRGCTSGSALSGMAVMSYGGIITMLAIFGSAYAFAWFFRKMWISR